MKTHMIDYDGEGVIMYEVLPVLPTTNGHITSRDWNDWNNRDVLGELDALKAQAPSVGVLGTALGVLGALSLSRRRLSRRRFLGLR